MATAKEETNRTKVLVNVYEPLIVIMKHKMDAACLKRDAYLDKALRCEAELLREEITSPNSERAKTFIADNLKQLRLKPLNLLLSQETVELINDVCKEKNVPRDVFINRFCLLLIASDVVLSALFKEILELETEYDNTSFADIIRASERGGVPLSETYPHEETTGDRMRPVQSLFQPDFYNRDNVLDTIEAFVTGNPFARLRAGILMIAAYGGNLSGEEYERYRNFHSITFKKDALQTLPDEYEFLKSKNTLGFNTFMTDDQISAQEAIDEAISSRSEKDKLLAAMRKEKELRPKKEKQTSSVNIESEGETL